MRRTALFVAMTAFVAVASAQTPLDKTMVVVNGQAIKAPTYFKRMEVLPNVGKLVENRFAQATPGFMTLARLIDETLLLQLAGEKGVAPTESEINAEFTLRTTENPDLLKGLQMIGFTPDDLKYDIKVQLAEFKLTTMGVIITDQQVDQFYKDNIALYTKDKMYALSIIAVDNDERRKAVDADLATGKSFSDVAKARSLHATAADGGSMGEVPEGELSDTLKRLVSNAKAGTVTDWLTAEGLFLKVNVTSVKPKEVVPLDAKLKSTIRRNMMIDRGRVRNDLEKMMKDMRAKAKIDYQGTIFDEQLKKSLGG